MCQVVSASIYDKNIACSSSSGARPEATLRDSIPEGFDFFSVMRLDRSSRCLQHDRHESLVVCKRFGIKPANSVCKSLQTLRERFEPLVPPARKRRGYDRSKEFGGWTAHDGQRGQCRPYCQVCVVPTRAIQSKRSSALPRSLSTSLKMGPRG